MKRYIGIMAMAFSIMVSCGKKENIQSVEPVMVDTPLTFAAHLDNGFISKTTLVDGTKVYWQEGDTFWGFHVYGENNVEVLQFTLVSGAGEKQAIFESEIPHKEVAEGDILYAVYGCELNASHTLPVWPGRQFASTSGTPLTSTTERNISCVPMFAKTTAESEDTFYDGFFKNAGGLVQINVTNNTESDIKPDKLRIDAQVPISGEFNLPVFDAYGIPSFTFTSASSNHIVWTFDDDDRIVYSGSVVPLNVVLPYGSYSGLKFTYTGGFGDIPYGFVRTQNPGTTIDIHRSQIDKISMNLFKELPIGPDSPVGTIGTYADLKDPHHHSGRTGMIVGFDFSTGEPKSKLVICTANLVLQGDTELDDEEHPWEKGTLIKYNVTNKHTAGGHWRLMTVGEARDVMDTDENGTGQAKWGRLNGVEGIYWYFDPERYGEYGANVIPNSIFLPVTHQNAIEGNRAEGRYWLDGNWYFEFYQDPGDSTKGIVNVIYEKDLALSDHLGALRLVHDIVDTSVL